MENLVKLRNEPDPERMTPAEAAAAWKKVVEIYNLSRDTNSNPNVTASMIITELGRKKAYEIFAIVTQIKKYDGRIYGDNRTAMESIKVNPDCLKWESGNPVCKAGLDDIHTSHINQIITEIRKR